MNQNSLISRGREKAPLYVNRGFLTSSCWLLLTILRGFLSKVSTSQHNQESNVSQANSHSSMARQKKVPPVSPMMLAGGLQKFFKKILPGLAFVFIVMYACIISKAHRPCIPRGKNPRQAYSCECKHKAFTAILL